jgi:hypothetical protein
MFRLLWLLWCLLFETAPDDETDDEGRPDDDGDEDDPAVADDDGDQDEAGEDTRDPQARIKSLLAANDRLAKKNTKLQKALSDGSQGDGADLVAVRRENAFLRAVLERGETLDMDTAWDLMNAKGFIDLMKVSDDGEVSGAEEAMQKLVDRYPWLLDADGSATDEPTRMPPPSGGRAKKKHDTTAVRHADLKGRLPALRRSR